MAPLGHWTGVARGGPWGRKESHVPTGSRIFSTRCTHTWCSRLFLAASSQRLPWKSGPTSTNHGKPQGHTFCWLGIWKSMGANPPPQPQPHPQQPGLLRGQVPSPATVTSSCSHTCEICHSQHSVEPLKSICNPVQPAHPGLQVMPFPWDSHHPPSTLSIQGDPACLFICALLCGPVTSPAPLCGLGAPVALSLWPARSNPSPLQSHQAGHLLSGSHGG